MSLEDVNDWKLHSDLEVLTRIERSLSDKKPLSLVRVGDGENVVMAQESGVLSAEDYHNSKWIQVSSKKGVTLPSLQLRDDLINSIKKADIVGVLKKSGDPILTPPEYKRPLTNQLFNYYQINPVYLCDACVNRKIASYKLFWRTIHKYRTLLISIWAKKFAKAASERYTQLPPKIVGCIHISNYTQITEVLTQVSNYQFDLALVSAGVNAVIIAQQIAERFGKVGIDFGKTMMCLVNNDPRVTPWRENMLIDSINGIKGVFISKSWRKDEKI